MNLDEHVYCIRCWNFRLWDEQIPYCMYEDKCELRNCEDSMPFSFRPFYEPGVVELLKILAEGCKTHPSYRAKRKVITWCETCNLMYEARQKLKGINLL